MEFDTRKTEITHQELRYARNSLEYDIYILLCILASSKSLHKNEKKFYGLFMQLMDFEKSEIYNKVFSIAIRVRNFIDNNKLKSESQIVGTIEEQMGEKKPLTLREACNKIIHSEHINFDIVNAQSHYEHKGIKEFIYVYGKKGKNNWKTTINLYKFLSHSMESLFV
ncbi:MAG: hypothetical protein B7Y37_08910 [Sphingobacteriia bacterium 28-36-52]|nr:MAG: hypothetical protein B7Y37_08910 [Sphingobacteriia bacterium 28-36-52]